MRPIIRRGLPAAVAVIALAAIGTGAGGTAYVLTASPAKRPVARKAAPQVVSVVPTVEQPAPLTSVVPPDYLVIGAQGVDGGQLARIGKIKKVRDTITVDAGSVQLQGSKVNMFAVDPSRFRAWTPPGTAANNQLWSALAQNQFVVSDEVAQQLSLRPGMQYTVAGQAQTPLTMGGTGTLGLPGINVLVSRDSGQRIGLVHDIGVLVNAPGADLTTLGKSLHKVLGEQSQIINLHEAQQPAQPDKPSKHDKTTKRKAGTYLELYKQSAGVCRGLSWAYLAAIGQVESDHGRNPGKSSAGALGPMQFMPATWRIYGVDGDGDGKADIMNPYDAVPAAAKYLCASGAPGDMQHAIFAYNHSQSYVNRVMSLARSYAQHYG